MPPRSSLAGPEPASDHQAESSVVDSAGVSMDRAEVEFDVAAERRLVRKLDRRLVLIAFLCCMLARHPSMTTWADSLDRLGCLP